MSTSYQARISKAANVIKSYFTDLSVAEANLTQALERMGIDDTDIGQDTLNAKTTTFEDFEKAQNKGHPGVINTNIPLTRLKIVWSILKDEANEPVKEAKVSMESDMATLLKDIKPISQWKNQDLLETYSRDCQVAIVEELSKRTKSRQVIIFNEDGSVDIENSLYMIKKSQFQETPSLFKSRSGDIKETFRVGEWPLEAFFECPAHKDTLLLDGYCAECGEYWDTEDSDKNILFRLVIENENIDARLYRKMSFTELKTTFPKVYFEYRDLKDENKLPSLKRKISKAKNGDPFRVLGSHKTY